MRPGSTPAANLIALLVARTGALGAEVRREGVAAGIGAIDDLASLADLAGEERLWFHVDGAFGAQSPGRRPARECFRRVMSLSCLGLRTDDFVPRSPRKG